VEGRVHGHADTRVGEEKGGRLEGGEKSSGKIRDRGMRDEAPIRGGRWGKAWKEYSKGKVLR